jgi:hypothetical protein
VQFCKETSTRLRLIHLVLKLCKTLLYIYIEHGNPSRNRTPRQAQSKDECASCLFANMRGRVHVALLIQHATGTRHTVTSFVAPLAAPYFF